MPPACKLTATPSPIQQAPATVVSPRFRSYSVDAIVVRANDFGEADRLVTLLTPFRGLVRAVARGARKPKSRIGGNLDLLRHVRVSLNRGRSLDSVSQTDTQNGFRSIRAGLARASTGLYLAELAENFSVEGGPNPGIFEHLRAALEILDQETIDPLLPRWYEVWLLRLAGFLPAINACVDCESDLEPRDHVFSAARGGLVCPDCRAAENDILVPASMGAIKLLRHMARAEWDAVRGLNIAGEDMRQVTRLLREHIHFVIDRRVRSAAFMDEVASQSR